MNSNTLEFGTLVGILFFTINLIFQYHLVNLAYRKKRSVLIWFMIGLISPIIVYYIIKQLKTITKDPTYGQNIIAPNDIENVYNTSSGVYVLGGGKVILNNEIAGDGKHKLGFLLNIHVENGLIQKVSPF